MDKYVCTICGFIYDEAKGIPEAGIAPGTKWGTLPDNWTCPLCGASKADFKLQSEEKKAEQIVKTQLSDSEEMKELSFGQMSALCSNLAKGCEKQYLQEEAALFQKLAEYYKAKAGNKEGDYADLMRLLNENLESNYPKANAVASNKPDRGALRALVWSEKVTRMLNSILTRYEKEKDALLNHTNIYVCEICGFVYIGDTPPDICPVCKVPNQKMTLVERG